MTTISTYKYVYRFFFPCLEAPACTCFPCCCLCLSESDRDSMVNVELQLQCIECMSWYGDNYPCCSTWCGRILVFQLLFDCHEDCSCFPYRNADCSPYCTCCVASTGLSVDLCLFPVYCPISLALLCIFSCLHRSEEEALSTPFTSQANPVQETGEAGPAPERKRPQSFDAASD